ncbi:MAG: helix-turn-helix domain-containing protein [Oscillospiraceae bacterium]|nr:helix-turn-helix domain-containing protein [Oscillospiraceae bacterium]
MNRIRELRKKKDLTQKGLAKHLKVADSTLSYWEMGKYEPDNKALKMLSEFFQVPIDYILGGDFTKWDFYRDGTLYPENIHLI